MADTARGGRAGQKRPRKPELIRVEQIYPVHARMLEVRRRGKTVCLKHSFKAACGARPVLVERLFEPNFLEKIKFPYIERLKRWKWWPLLFRDDEVPTNVVKVFYFRGDNALYGRNDEDEDIPTGETQDSFRTTVLDYHFDIDEAFIRQYVGDERNAGPTVCPNEKNYPYVQACREIYGNNGIQKFEKSAKHMNLYNRILHLMVCQVFDPRAGDFSKATHSDIWWMHRIINNDPPNLSGMIVTRMLAAAKDAKSDGNEAGLPYGRLVSRICEDKCWIHEDEPLTPPLFKKPFGEDSLGGLGWVLDRATNTYVRSKPDTSGASSSGGTQSVESELLRMNEVIGGFSNRLSIVEEQQFVIQQQQFVLQQQNRRIFDEIRGTRSDDPFPSFPDPRENPR